MTRLDIPCLKYLIDRVRTDDDLSAFCAFFIKILSSEGLTQDQMAAEYVSKVPQHNSSGISMYSVGGEKQDAITLIQRGAMWEGAPVTPCFKYCKNILKDNYCDICKTCAKYGRSYCNDFEKEEYALLKYASSTKENLIQVESWVRGSKCIFRTRSDIVADLDYLKPVVVPITLAYFNQLKKSVSFFQISDLSDRLKSGVVVTHFWSRLYKLAPEAEEVIGKFDRLKEVVYGTLVNNILSANDITEDIGAEIINTMISTHGSGRNINKSQQEDSSLNGQIDILSIFEQSEASDIRDKNTEHTEKDDSAPGQDINDNGSLPFDVSANDIIIPVVGSAKINKNDSITVPTEPDDNYREKSLPDIEDTSETNEGESYPDNIPEELFVNQKDTVYSNTSSDIKPVMQDISENLLYIPDTWPDFISHFTPYIEYENNILESIDSDRLMQFDIIRSDGSYYILIYDTRRSDIVYAREDILPESLKAVFASRKILKVTWQPFYVYSMLKSYCICVRNIYSLLLSYFIYALYLKHYTSKNSEYQVLNSKKT